MESCQAESVIHVLRLTAPLMYGKQDKMNNKMNDKYHCGDSIITNLILRVVRR